MIKANELEEWSKDILPVLFDINISLTNLRIIETERKNELHIMKHGFFRYMYSQQRFIIIIQLAKIFSDSGSQKKNFIKLCNRFETEKIDQKIKDLLTENSKKFTQVFKSHQDILDAVKKTKNDFLKHKNTIDNINFARDKVYAHTDSNKILPKIVHKELEELVEFANDTYNTLFGCIFDRHFLLERTSDWDLRYIIQRLSEKK